MDNKTISNANSNLDISELSDSSTSEESLNHSLHKPNWLNLLKNLSEFYMESLKLIFHDQKTAANINNPGLSKIEFCHAIKQIYGKEIFVAESLSLFNEIDGENNSVISWDQFLDFFRRNIRADDFPRMELSQPVMIDIPHVQRDTIRKIISLESEKYFSYAIVTIYGKVGLYNGNLELLTTYSVIMSREDISKPDDDRRKRNRLITDAIYTEDNFMIFYANSARSLMIYDASCLNHTPLWLIISFPNIIDCLAYTRQKSKIQNSILFLGYDNGKKISIEFKKQPDLFPKKQNDKLTVLYWQEVEGENEFIRLKKKILDHKNNVTYMEYVAQQKKLISCSKDPKKSVIIDYIESKNNSYIFKIHRGTNCFAYSASLNILITGSEDGFVRIFNPVVTEKPILASACHRHAIVDVAIFSVIGFFMTISRDAELRLWEIKEFRCVQIVKMKFPCLRDGRIIQWGVKCFFSGPKRRNKNAILNGNFYDRFLDDENIEIAAVKNDDEKNICTDYWERSNILVICCNNVCTIGLNFYDDKNRNFDSPVLPIQPLLNSVLIPNDWILGDAIKKSTGKINTVVTKEEYTDKSLQEKIDKSLEELKFVLERNLTGFIDKNHETNFKLVQLEEQKRKMQFYVENGAPFLALDLYAPDELQIPIHLPVPNNPKIQKLVAHIRNVLSNAKARDIIFSDRSSSTKSLRSSRSSFMELN